ncbi:hypothetical protein L6452_11179 [Arctium lappa]|uniref:Uncharacterized protein n=1 Tax=Arctium lappa TaxID=4217 RepID=A0ACB9DNV1_ARCLA|nr:hypothetical protein L6452_11179 [Arctium lappa]
MNPPQDNDIHHRPFSYNPNVFPSEMLNPVARNPHLLLPSAHGFVSLDHDSFPGSSQPERVFVSSDGGSFPNLPNECNNWKTVVSSQQPQLGNESNDHWNVVSYSNSGSMNIDHRSLNSGGYGYHQDVQNVPAFGSSPFYHSILPEDQVTLAQHHQNKNDSGMNQSIPYWMNNSDESSSFLANRIHDHREQMTTPATTTTMGANEGNCNTQALCLSLSSLPQPKDDDLLTLQPGEKPLKSDLLPNSDPKCFMGVSSFAHRNTGPLGPFTGYATILKNSKYLKPAQELLNVNCEVGDQELVQTCHDVFSRNILEDEMSRASGGSNEHNSSGAESLQPEFHRKKARLLYMQEEVCRRYKQYLQQMQMVISSFETVAGLSAATPYVCLALKAVARHFHFVKNVISEQLLQMRKMVGEGLSSSTTTSSKAFDGNGSSASRLKSIDQRFSKSGSGGGAAGFFTSPQPVWRPQRGLPERAIAVLKTWLFDHFLHPYPSDADKHMLATQTGLTRNQVSNWFINARVRIWKPMVEEIHTLETKGLAEPNSTNPPPAGHQDPSSRMDMTSFSNMQPPDQSCSRNPDTTRDEPPNDQLQQQDQEKLGRPEYQIPLASMDRLMSIMPYPRATFDASGLGPVSLTLGLRQNAENVQQLQQHFGGQLIHDFVG